MTPCPRTWRTEGCPSFSNPEECARARRPVRVGAFNASSPFRHSLAAKVGGGRGHHVVHGREAGEVEAGFVQFWGREVEAGCG
jgi:hypothetical protein